MSVVTNVMLAVGILDEDVAFIVKDWSVPTCTPYDQKFTRLDEESGWGGSKYPEVVLFGGAFNHLRTDTLQEFLAALPWKWPDEAQLFIQRQNADKWAVYELEGGSWCRLVKERQ